MGILENMENEELNNKIIIKYNLAIYNFEENFIKEINGYKVKVKDKDKEKEVKDKVKDKVILEGYLINHNDYEEVKEKINYKNNINEIRKNYHYSDIKIEIKEKEKIFNIKDIEFKTPKFFMNMISNGNKYILINKELWDVICEPTIKDSPPVKYEINKSSIILHLDSNSLTFNNNGKNNILDKNTYKASNTNDIFDEEINKIYEDINNYYKFEK